MSLGARIRQARLRAGLTQGRLAEYCDKSTQTVSGWERDLYEPSRSDLMIVAQVTNVNFELLSTGTSSGSGAVDGVSRVEWRGRVVPSVDWQNLEPYLAGDYTPSMSARSQFECGPRAFYTIVTDRSNEPEISVGDSLVVDPDLRPQPGDLILIRLDGALAVRRYRPRTDHIELAPYNEDWPTAKVATIRGGDLIGVVSESARPRRR